MTSVVGRIACSRETGRLCAATPELSNVCISITSSGAKRARMAGVERTADVKSLILTTWDGGGVGRNRGAEMCGLKES